MVQLCLLTSYKFRGHDGSLFGQVLQHGASGTSTGSNRGVRNDEC